MTSEEYIQELLNRIQQQTATAQDYQRLNQLIAEDESGDLALWANTILSGRPDVTAVEAAPAEHWQAMLRRILDTDKSNTTEAPAVLVPIQSRRTGRRWGWVAAAILLLAIGGGYYWNRYNRPEAPLVKTTPATDIQPGRSGAILTLADGSQVELDSMGNGVVAAQNGAQIWLQNGQLKYDTTGQATTAMVFNTMTTPRGRQFRLTLPDGTQVWLNAMSSITYPTVFAGSERKVELKGEAYFEVAKNAAMPFKVHAGNNAYIQVLGTHFNINAYDNEAVLNTTLLEGSVRVKQQNDSVTIQPGQQAGISSGKRITVLSNVDIDKVMAWKNGVFNFEGASLEEIMRQFERWYDIEVLYEKGVPDIGLTGEITRGVTLQGLLAGLSELGLHYRIEERKLIVLP